MSNALKENLEDRKELKQTALAGEGDTRVNFSAITEQTFKLLNSKDVNPEDRAILALRFQTFAKNRLWRF